MTPRLWVIAGGTRTTASSRHRLWNYRPLLEADGVELRWTEYLGGRTRSVLRAALTRARFLMALSSPPSAGAVLLIQKVLPPSAWVRRWKRAGHRVVYDFDDALYEHLSWGEPAGRAARRRRRFDRMLQLADHVIAGSPPLADYAKPRTAHVDVLYPSLDRATLSAPPPRSHGPRAGVVLGWIGNDQSQRYLQALSPSLAPLFERHAELRLCVCSSRPPELPPALSERLDFVPWSEEGEREATARFDIAISPMGTEPWSRARGGRVSVLLSMAAALPVVAAPGGGLEALTAGQGIEFADSSDAWQRALDALIQSPALRERRGAEARAVIDREIWADVQYPKLYRILFGRERPTSSAGPSFAQASERS
ncbi:MAG: glycosyltransferase [Gemmatimonadota bacterium]